MIYTSQILLFGILVIIILNRIDRISVDRFKKLREEKIDEFLDKVDSYFIARDSSELSGIAYRSRLLLELAENDAETIAGMRILLGAVSTMAQNDDEVEEIKKSYEIAIAALRAENYAKLQFCQRWKGLCKKKILPVDEKAIIQGEKKLLLKQSNMIKNTNK